MVLALNQLFILKRFPPDSVRTFVEFWAERYHYPDEQLYDRNITGPHTRKGLSELFKWKIGTRFFAAKKPSVQQNFISRVDEAQHLLRSPVSQDSHDVAIGFLEHFKDGGAIWRIFWLHCWDTRFPIYDQHVHRAMAFIENGRLEELSPYPDKVCVHALFTRRARLGESCGARTASGGRLDGR